MLHQGKVDFTPAMGAAEYALEHHHAERAGTLHLGEMRFDGKPGEFIDWWTSQLKGNYEHGGDFIQECERRAKWVKPSASPRAVRQRVSSRST